MSRGLTSRLRVATLAAEGASAKIRSLLASLSLPSRQQAPWANWGAHTSQWFTQIWSLRMTSKAPGNAYPHIYMISITEKTPEIGWLFHGFQKIIFHGMMITQSCSYGTINRQPESLTAILLGTGNANATPAAFPPPNLWHADGLLHWPEHPDSSSQTPRFYRSKCLPLSSLMEQVL